MEVTNSKDAMTMLLVAMRRETVLAYQDMDEFTYDDANYYLATYVEHVRKARSYGIKLKDVKNMYNYIDTMMKSRTVMAGDDALKFYFANKQSTSQMN
jgi:hypothetical protein